MTTPSSIYGRGMVVSRVSCKDDRIKETRRKQGYEKPQKDITRQILKENTAVSTERKGSFDTKLYRAGRSAVPLMLASQRFIFRPVTTDCQENHSCLSFEKNLYKVVGLASKT